LHHLEAFGGSEEQLVGFMTELGYVPAELRGRVSRDVLFVPALSDAETRV